ncbi:MAG: hypothetical protein ACLFO2_01915 [Candidatus Woesearchaeota archaeon]
MKEANNSTRYADQLLLQTAKLYSQELRQTILRNPHGYATSILESVIEELESHETFKERYGTTLQDRLTDVKQSLERETFTPEQLKPLEEYLDNICW